MKIKTQMIILVVLVSAAAISWLVRFHSIPHAPVLESITLKGVPK